jgi:hypothetical protein
MFKGKFSTIQKLALAYAFLFLGVYSLEHQPHDKQQRD